MLSFKYKFMVQTKEAQTHRQHPAQDNWQFTTDLPKSTKKPKTRYFHNYIQITVSKLQHIFEQEPYNRLGPNGA